MGIDYFSCNYCSDSFPDVIDYVSCDCGNHWCSEECAKKDKFRRKVNGDSSCKFCRGEDFSDGELLKYSLKLLGKTRKELITQYKNKK